MDKMLFNINYFEPAVQNEEYPYKIPKTENDKYRKLEMIFNLYYDEESNNNSRELSKKEREYKLITDKSFSYGEVTFRSMAYIFEYAKNIFGINENGYFYDFGSGSGKGIISALLCYNFKKYVAIEFLEDLIKKSAITIGTFLGNFSIYYSQMKDFLPNYSFEQNSNIPSISIKNGDFLNENVTNASFIFINSTSFSTQLMYNLTKKIQTECQIGCIVVTFTKKLPLLNLEEWDILPGFKRLMSWGIVTVFIHKRKNNDYMEKSNVSDFSKSNSKYSNKSSSNISSKKSKSDNQSQSNKNDKYSSSSSSSSSSSTYKNKDNYSNKKGENSSSRKEYNSSSRRDKNSSKINSND